MASANASMASCSLPLTVPAQPAAAHLAGASAHDVLLVLDNYANDAERVMNGAVELVNDVLCAAAEDHADCLRVLALLDEDHVLVADLALFHEACVAQIRFRELVDAGAHAGTGALGELLEVGFLDTAGSHNACLRQVVLDEVVHTLLAEHDIGAGLLDLVDHVLEHLLFLVQEALELVRAGDLDLGVDLCLLDLQRAVEQRDLRVLHHLRHVRVDAFLVDYDALDELGVADGAAYLLLYLDVIGVDLAVLVDNCLDRFDDEVGELLPLPRRPCRSSR
jgi:hypothetical protein